MYKNKTLSEPTTAYILIKFLSNGRELKEGLLAINDAFYGNFKRFQEIGWTKEDFENCLSDI